MPSQFGQDLFVLEILDGMREGYFLDAGAADGVSSSNTFLLENSFEWDGICVEPNRDFFSLLRVNRKCRCLNCCLYVHDGTVPFLEAAGMLGGIVTHYPQTLLQYARTHFPDSHDATGTPKVENVPACSVSSLLRRHSQTNIIDYWSLDTEGSELEILKAFPFDEFVVRVITVEHNFTPAREQIRSFLNHQGYERVRSLQIDDCYVLRRQGSQRAWRSRAFTALDKR